VVPNFIAWMWKERWQRKVLKPSWMRCLPFLLTPSRSFSWVYTSTLGRRVEVWRRKQGKSVTCPVAGGWGQGEKEQEEEEEEEKEEEEQEEQEEQEQEEQEEQVEGRSLSRVTCTG